VGRVVWIRIFGTPVHAWKEDFFKKIVEPFGELLVLDWDTSQKRRLDFARVLIKTSSSSFINQVDKVKIDNLFFMIRVLEELEHNYGVRAPSKNQVSEFSEEEESNNQPWFEKHEEEDDRDTNSQNMEREYNSFNEVWELEHGRGGADKELLETPRNKCNIGASGIITGGSKKALDSLERESRTLQRDRLQEVNSENLHEDNLGQKHRPNSMESMFDPIVSSKTHEPPQHHLIVNDLSIEELRAAGQVNHVSKEKEKTLSLLDEPIADLRGDESIQQKHETQTRSTGDLNSQHRCEESSQQKHGTQCRPTGDLNPQQSLDKQSRTASAKEDNKICINCKDIRRRRRLFPKLKDLARTKPKHMKKRRKQTSKDSQANEEGVDILSSSNQVNVSLESSISGEISEWRKWVILHDQPERVAEKVWEFGKEANLICENEGDLIRELTNIEFRDRPKAANNSEHQRGAERINNGDQ
jgi:hypothetical protein